jgi:hypothetical protein
MKSSTIINSFKTIPPKGISWRAIIAGTIAALALMLILNLIGMAIGLWSIEPTEENKPLSGLGTGSIIWWVLSNLIVLFTGGFVAARLGSSYMNLNGVLHGIMTWALYTIISAWLLTSIIGRIISGVGNVVGSVLSETGQVVSDQVGPMIKDQFEDIDISLNDAKEEFYSILEDTGKEELNPRNLRNQGERAAQEGAEEMRRTGRTDSTIEGIFSNARNIFDQSFEEIDQEALVNILVERTDMTEAEAQRMVENNIAEFEQARAEFQAYLEETKAKAKETAEDVAEAAGDAAMYLALALLLGIAAAAGGGYLGVKHLREDYLKTEHQVTERNVAYDRGEIK